MTWIMLNPSTAGARRDDATIRRCRGFANREGCSSIEVVNLFALVATKPRALLSDLDPVGLAGGDEFIVRACEGRGRNVGGGPGADAGQPPARDRGKQGL